MSTDRVESIKESRLYRLSRMVESEIFRYLSYESTYHPNITTTHTENQVMIEVTFPAAIDTSKFTITIREEL